MRLGAGNPSIAVLQASSALVGMSAALGDITT
jgi:hypothetical protein